MQTEKLAFFKTLGHCLVPIDELWASKWPLTSRIAFGEMFKRGIYKRRGNEFKNIWPAERTTGMHFATTAMCQLTCGLDQLVPAAPYLVHRSVKLLVGIWLEHA